MKILIVGGVVLGVAGVARADRGDVELSGFTGGHLFSTHSELGVADGKREPSPEDGFGFGPRMGVFLTSRLSLEAELALVPTSTRGATKCGGTTGVECPDLLVFGWRGHALFALTGPDATWRPFVLLGGGAMTVSSTNADVVHTDTDLAWHAGVGVKYAVKSSWGVRADVRMLLPPSSSSSGVTVDFEGWVGVYATFGKPTPEPKKEEVVKKVAMPPEEVVVHKAPPPPDPDPDHDGVIGDADHCPDEAGKAAAGGVTPDGCPEKDSDGDGVLDSVDQCPHQAGAKVGAAVGTTADGCPESDRDRDVIADQLDKCPDQPETLNGWQDTDGCPDTVPPELSKAMGTLPVTFQGDATISKASEKKLDALAATLVKYADARFQIAAFDTPALAQPRADAVKAYLVGKGVDAGRLEASGKVLEGKGKARVELAIVAALPQVIKVEGAH